ncbi:hypothetical protein [Pseudooceanicola sp. LIPI14-2-Ac024]|uniref:hypothetical protein n=1 Tax=Pseudooceanicola sp. LIPI14-2-Ac024 TaxID=3344875 RepID=UPI0035D0FDD4
MPVDNAPAATRKIASFVLSAEPERWTSAGLRDLPKGLLLDAQVRASAPVWLHIVAETGMAGFLETGASLVSTGMALAPGVSAVVPEAGDYFLIIDNRDGDRPSEAQVTISTTEPGQVDPSDWLQIANNTLAQVAKALGTVFRIDSPDLRVEPVGSLAPFREAEDAIGAEFSRHILEHTTAATASPLMILAIFRHLGPRLLALSPGPAPEDESFPAALMVMLGYRSQCEAALDYLGTPELSDRLVAPLPWSPFPTVDMAIDWKRRLAGGGLLSDWESRYLGALRDDMLTRLQHTPPEWLAPAALEREIAGRTPKA